MKKQPNQFEKFRHLNGKYNGWWIYQHATGDWNAKYYEYRKNARRAKNGNL